MTRSAVVFDRVAIFVAGLCLLAFGGCVIAWQLGTFGTGATFRLMFAGSIESSWWPWALGTSGILLILLCGRWIATHRWPPKASRVALPAGHDGLTADATSVAAAAGDALQDHAGVVKARGTATMDRGTPTVTLTVTVPAQRGLRAGATAADRTAETVGAMLGDSVAVRTVLRVDAKRRSAVD